MKWLITGGCGFIGINLVRKLATEEAHSIRILDNLSVGTRDDLAAACEFIELNPSQVASETPLTELGPPHFALIVGDVLDERLALELARGVDVIVHLAASAGVVLSIENPRMDCLTNVIGTLNYLEAARMNGVRRFVFASSCASVGECLPPIREDMVPRPVSPYGAGKLSGEAYCSAYHRSFGMETVTLRFGNVYGPFSGHKNSVVAKFIRDAMASESLKIFGDGKQTRDFIYIEDLVEAIQLAARQQDVAGEIFQIATNSETTVGELANEVLSVFAEAGFGKIGVLFTEPRLGDVRRNFSDTSKARRMLGWQSKIALREGLRRTVEWFLHGGRQLIN